MDDGRAELAIFLSDSGAMSLAEAENMIAPAIVEESATANGKKMKLKSAKERLSEARRRVLNRK